MIMKYPSFSQNVKSHLREIPIKKKCCRHAFNDGVSVFSGGDSPADLVNKGSTGLVCADCTSHFIAGLFVASGNVSDPNKNYHLEFSLPDELTADAVCDVLTNAGFEPGRTTRKNRSILYFKNSALIEDILGFMGASFGVFEVMNAKIIKELREDTNRQVNCDSANILKTVGAAERQISVINAIIDSGDFDAMSDELKSTAELRLKFHNATMIELGKQFSPPISKSGVKHRLDKIAEFYEKQTLRRNSNRTTDTE